MTSSPGSRVAIAVTLGSVATVAIVGLACATSPSRSAQDSCTPTGSGVSASATSVDVVAWTPPEGCRLRSGWRGPLATREELAEALECRGELPESDVDFSQQQIFIAVTTTTSDASMRDPRGLVRWAESDGGHLWLALEADNGCGGITPGDIAIPIVVNRGVDVEVQLCAPQCAPTPAPPV